MKHRTREKNRGYLISGTAMLLLFVIWTIAVSVIDVKPIGPYESTVGLAGVNGYFHNLTGINMSLYFITDWLSLVPGGIVAGFGILGLVQWIKRKSFSEIDFSILLLGGFYIVTFALFFSFQVVIINYRPVLIDEVLEASYPSSTTMLSLCVIPTAVMQFGARIKEKVLKGLVCVFLNMFAVFMVTARLLSGIHWLTDIIGGVFLSIGLVMMYRYVCNLKN